MKKIEAASLELAYAQAAKEFGCSVTQMQVEIIQFPSKGILGLFKKPAIIVANLPVSIAPQKTPSASMIFITTSKWMSMMM